MQALSCKSAEYSTFGVNSVKPDISRKFQQSGGAAETACKLAFFLAFTMKNELTS